jgi:hypothetical protein
MNSERSYQFGWVGLLFGFCVILVYLAWGIANNYNTYYAQALRTVSAIEAESDTYHMNLNPESGIGIIFPIVSHNNYLFLRLSPNDTYQIVFYKNNKKTSSFVLDSGPWASILDDGGYKPILHLIPGHISTEGYTAFNIFAIRGDGEYAAANIRTENFEERPKGFYLSHNIIDFEIKQLEIEIKNKNFEKIQKKRNDALKLGMLLADDEDAVSARIRAGGKGYDADVRLKGDLRDHWIGDKWSFRIELKGNFCVYGMQKFSVQTPETRVFLYERMIYEWYREQGGIALRYNFIDVFLNGEYKGVYALEEFMEKRVIEYSRKREGPIIKLDEDVFVWERWAIYNPKLKNLTKKTDNIFSGLQVFSEKKINAAENLSGYAQYGIDLLNRAIENSIAPAEVFDFEQYAKLLVILDIFKALHGLALTNIRNYYNPVTAKLEPIPFDEYALMNHLPYSFMLPSSHLHGVFPTLLFSDSEFRTLYKKYAEKIFSEVNSFLHSQEMSLRQYETIIRRDIYGYSLKTDFMLENITVINNILSGERTAPAAKIMKSGDQYTLIISNNDTAPIVVTGLYDGSGNRLEIKEFINSTWNSEWTMSFPQQTDWDIRSLAVSFQYYFVENEQHIPVTEGAS